MDKVGLPAVPVGENPDVERLEPRYGSDGRMYYAPRSGATVETSVGLFGQAAMSEFEKVRRFDAGRAYVDGVSDEVPLRPAGDVLVDHDEVPISEWGPAGIAAQQCYSSGLTGEMLDGAVRLARQQLDAAVAATKGAGPNIYTLSAAREAESVARARWAALEVMQEKERLSR